MELINYANWNWADWGMIAFVLAAVWAALDDIIKDGLTKMSAVMFGIMVVYVAAFIFSGALA